MRLSLVQRRLVRWPAAQRGMHRASSPRLAASAASSATVRPWRPSPGLLPRCSARGKTTTVVRLADLPQGALPPAPRPTAEDGTHDGTHGGEQAAGPAYPTMVLQARRNMQRFASCVLLTRVGGFYELYFEHAQELGPLLNLKVASKKTSAGPVPMAGFPFFQLDRFLKILVHDLGRHVAIAEEFPNAAADRVKTGGLLHDRRVARIVTPGTLIDETFMDPYTNNYVMAIYVDVDAADAAGRPYEGDATLPAAQRPPPPAPPPLVPAALASVALGLAWLDLSTGHFSTQPTTLAGLGAALSRVAPREIVLDERLQQQPPEQQQSQAVHALLSVLAEDRTQQPQQPQQLVTYAAAPPGVAALADWAPMLEAAVPAQSAGAFSAHEIAAGSLLLHYVRDRLQGLAMKLQPPVRHAGVQAMTIDRNSMRSLEIRQTLRDGGFRGSLLHAVRRTVTTSGARLLNEWLGAPSTSLAVIGARQDLVARFVQDEDLRDGVTQLLRRSHDAPRLVQKFALGRGSPDDLLDLAKTIAAAADIVELLTNARAHVDGGSDGGSDTCLASMAGRMQLARPLALAKKIRASVDEEGLQHQHELAASEAGAMLSLAEEAVQAEGALAEDGVVLPRREKAGKAAVRRAKAPSFRDYYGQDNEAWVMKPSASRGLAALHRQLAGLTRDREALADDLRRRLDAPSLVLKWTPGLGHICHVKGRDARRAKTDKTDAGGKTEKKDGHTAATTISSSRTTRSLHVPEWTALGQALDQVRAHIRAEEQRVFRALRAAVVRSLVPLRRNAAVLDELDIATAFARLALEQNLCRPRLHRGTSTVIVGGRHATVEGGLAAQGRTFTRNDLFLGGGGGGDGARVWLITGPNMGGKSTFLRQNALVTILAQAGCYVPADYADLGLVDALFSRVGSADNLFRDQSTFMVEMLETAHILRQATPRSFVIMDEIGRGTTPEDGTAVAYAVLRHLVRVNRCRALFATHFHGLADLAAADGLADGEGEAGLAAGTGDGGAFPVALYCTDVEEDGAGGFVYVHRLRRGINRQSHALKAARLAGLPEEALRTAEEVLGLRMTKDGLSMTNG